MYRARLALPALPLIVLVVLLVVLYLGRDEWHSKLWCNDLKLRSVRELIAVSHGKAGVEPTDQTRSHLKPNGEVCPREAFFRGRVALEQNRFDQAELLLSEGIDEAFPFPRLWLGWLYFHQSKVSQAVRVWSPIPSISNYLTQLGLNLEKSKNDRSGARALYKVALQLGPKNRKAHDRLGIMLVQSKEEDDLRLAIRHLHLALNGTLRDSTIFEYLGLAHERLNHKIEAHRYFMKSLAIRPGDYAVSSYLSNLLIREGQPDKAVPVLMRAITKDPSRSGSHYRLGKAFEAMGRVEPAIKAYSQACLLAPNRLDWKRHLEALRSR